MTNAFIITEEDSWFVATDFLTGIASQGKTRTGSGVSMPSKYPSASSREV